MGVGVKEAGPGELAQLGGGTKAKSARMRHRKRAELKCEELLKEK